MSGELQRKDEGMGDLGKLLMDPKFKTQLAAALPKHMTPDRMARIALTEVRKNPQLLRCDSMSFMGAIFQCAQLGLEPGNGLGHAFLVPFNNRKKGVQEVTFIPGYKGLVDLARRSGQIQDLFARCVYAKDEFDHTSGDNEHIDHKPFRGARKDRGELIAVYAIAKLQGGGIVREVMWKGDTDEIRDRFSHGNPVWKTDYDEMARKTVVRKLSKYLPLSPELRDAIAAEDAAEDGGQENWRVMAQALDISDYEPKQVISADATTIADVNRTDEAAAATSQRQGLEVKFIDETDRLVSEGMTEQNVAFHLNLTKFPDLASLTTEKLIVMTEKLKTLTGKK